MSVLLPSPPPDASSSLRGMVSGGAQTFAGMKEFLNGILSDTAIRLASDPSAALSVAGGIAIRSNAGVGEMSVNGGAYQTISTGSSGITALTGDVTAAGVGSVAATIAASAVTLAKMANLASNSIMGNNTGSPAAPLALTTAQVKTLLGYYTNGDSPSFGTLTLSTPLAIAQGGTGQVSANAALNALLPSQAGITSGWVLKTNGTNTSWVAPGASGPTTYVQWDNQATTTPTTGSFGAAWQDTGISGVSFSVDSSQGKALSLTTTAGNADSSHLAGVLTVAPASNDHKIRVAIRLPGSINTQATRFGVLIRGSQSSGSYSGYAFLITAWVSAAPTIHFSKWVASSESIVRGSVALSAYFPQLAGGDQLMVELEARGSWISLRINGLEIWHYYDTTYASGSPGVCIMPASSGGVQPSLLIDYLDVISYVDPFTEA